MSPATAERPPRLDAKHLLHEWGQELFSLERGLLHTVARLATRPGEAIRRYIEWRDPRMVRPTRLLLIVFAVAALIWQFDVVGGQFSAGFDTGINAGTGEHPMLRSMRLLAEHFSLILTLCWAPAAAGAFQRCYRALDINLAEAMVFGLYTLCLYIPLQLAMLALPSINPILTIVWFSLPALIIAWASWGYGRPDRFGLVRPGSRCAVRTADGLRPDVDADLHAARHDHLVSVRPIGDDSPGRRNSAIAFTVSVT